jgi:hypothetical protein
MIRLTVEDFIGLSHGTMYIVLEYGDDTVWEGFTSDWLGEYEDEVILGIKIVHDNEDVILYI